MHQSSSSPSPSSSQTSMKSKYTPQPIMYKNENLREFIYEMRQYIITAGYMNKYFGSQVPAIIFIIILTYYIIPHNTLFAMKYINKLSFLKDITKYLDTKQIIHVLAHTTKTKLSESQREIICRSIIREISGMTNYYFNIYQNPKLLYQHPKYPQKIDFYIKSIGKYLNLFYLFIASKFTYI